MALKPKRIGRAFPELRCTFDGQPMVPDVPVLQWENISCEADGTIGI